MKAELAVQPRLSIATLVLSLAIVVSVLFAHRHFLTLPDRQEIGPKMSEIRFERIRLGADGWRPLRLVGAWQVSSDDPRFGGISGLALDGAELLAITDSGVVIRFPKPGAASATAQLREVPAGSGDRAFKLNRDSEALVRDPAGRGWWVAYENSNRLWLYDSAFRRALMQVAVDPLKVRRNRGVEGLTVGGGELLALPEDGGRILRFGKSGWSERSLPEPRRLSEAAALSDDSILVIERGPGLLGFANALARFDSCAAGYCLKWRKRLPVGPLDNVEALTVEALPSGAIRLWMMTDDNGHRPFRTLLIAADLPPRA